MAAAVAAPGSLVLLSALLTPWARRRMPQHRDAAAVVFFFAVQVVIVSVAFAARPWLTALVSVLAVQVLVVSVWLWPTRRSRWEDFERKFRAWAEEREGAQRR
jgi:membrane protein YdbS with pleckstrin-like domain